MRRLKEGETFACEECDSSRVQNKVYGEWRCRDCGYEGEVKIRQMRATDEQMNGIPKRIRKIIKNEQS